MPRDMFGDIVARKPAVRARRSPVLVASIAAHVFVLLAILVASAVAPDILPTPREALAFYELRAVDIALPPPPPPRGPATAPSPAAAVSPDAAPVIAPTGITAETEARVSVVAGPALTSIEGGTATLDTIGASEPPPPPPPPRGPVRLHSGITAPRKVFDVAPKYPEIARAARVEGIVIIEATIDASGNVASAHVLRSKEPLDQAALDAVLKWRFTPALLNGEAIPVVITVTVNFKLE
jgi:periplasmic protein TonB